MSSLGDRSFAAAGPRAWNRLPPPLRRVHSAAAFKRQLKTFFILSAARPSLAACQAARRVQTAHDGPPVLVRRRSIHPTCGT